MNDRCRDDRAWTCQACGVQSALGSTPPDHCAICEDERQYSSAHVQRWAETDQLGREHPIRFADADGVTTMVLDPGFAINQRAFLIPHPGGNIMWEVLAGVTDEAVNTIRQHGGVTAIAISHPHFYGAMTDWSVALGNVPIYIHEADRHWVQRPCDQIRFWSGSRHSLTDQIELVQLGAHFDGSTGLWWKAGPRDGGSLFSGDAIQVAKAGRCAGFMYSYPNAIPLGSAALAGLQSRVADIAYDDIYGFSDDRQIIGGAKAEIDASFQRSRAAIVA